MSSRPLKVFLCHAHADRDPMRTLHARLTKDGVDAWLDKANLLPGQDWELEIRKAVREADVVVVCLSKQFNQAGFRQKEVRLALDTAMEKPEGEIFIIPARLEECDNLESLKKWHWVDLFEGDGYEMLMRALRARANKIGATLQIKRSWLPTGNTQPAVVKKTSPPVEKPKKEIQTSKKFNRNIIGVIGFVVLVLVSIFGLPSLIGKPEPTPAATSAKYLENITPTLEKNTPFASFTPTQSQTPTAVPSSTATFVPRSITWEGKQIELSGQPISENTIGNLMELAKIKIDRVYAHSTGTESLQFLNDDQSFIYQLGTVTYLRNMNDGSVLGSYEQGYSYGCLDISQDEKTLAYVTYFGKIRVWNVNDGSQIYNFQSSNPTGMGYAYELMCPINLSIDGSKLVANNSAARRSYYDVTDVSIWQFPDMKLIKTMKEQTVIGFSPDETLLTSCGTDFYDICMWDTNDWSLKLVLHDIGGFKLVSSDYKLVASIKEQKILIYRFVNEEAIQTLEVSNSETPSLFLSDDILITRTKSSVKFWQISNGKLIHEINFDVGDDGRIGSIAQSSDGTSLLISTPDSIRLFGVAP